MSESQLVDLNDPATIDKLSLLIHKALTKELHQHPLTCRFKNVNDNDAETIGTYVGLLSERDDIHLVSFFDSILENHRWLEKQRKRGDKISVALLAAMAIGFFSSCGAALWLGIKEMAK